VFVVFNIPWAIVAVQMFSGSLWGISRVPYIAPWIAWQFLGWIILWADLRVSARQGSVVAGSKGAR